MTEAVLDRPTAVSTRPPRVGFLGVGWIGRHRMEAMLGTGAIQAAAIADADPDAAEGARSLAPNARVCADLEDLLAQNLDGVVIATPSALHAAQTIQALERGVAVFCQKPLGRSLAEVEACVAAARRADRLLAVDFSYRETAAVRAIRETLRSGELGPIFSADLVFHNAYGPDKPWFYDPALSGGGCMMDLGVHLIDLALWLLAPTRVVSVSAVRHAQGRPVEGRGVAEDHGVATLVLDTGAVVRIACSWKLHAGRDADISAAFHGPLGGVEMRNVEGSFYDFTVDRMTGTSRRRMVSPPDDWGGRAAAAWARRLASDAAYDASVESMLDSARVLDRIYGSSSETTP